MRLWKGPIRWSKEGSGAPRELLEALRSAQAQLGTRDQVHRMAQRLEPQIGKLSTSIAPGTTFLGNQSSIVSNLQTLLSVFAIAVSTTAVLWYLPSGSPAPAATPDKSAPVIKQSSRPAIAHRTGETVELSSDTVVEERERPRVGPVRPRSRTLQPLRPRHKQVPEVKTRLDPEDELKILRAAQDDLVDRPIRALKRTEQHRRDYPSGVFAQEREMIAIEALFQLSRVNQGMNRAKRFLQRFGDSTHAPRVRSLLEEETETDRASR
jgi:hypothetical protein